MQNQLADMGGQATNDVRHDVPWGPIKSPMHTGPEDQDLGKRAAKLM